MENWNENVYMPAVTPIDSFVKLSSIESVSLKMFKPTESLLKILCISLIPDLT